MNEIVKHPIASMSGITITNEILAIAGVMVRGELHMVAIITCESLPWRVGVTDGAY